MSKLSRGRSDYIVASFMTSANLGLSVVAWFVFAGLASAQEYPCKPEPEDNLGAFYRKLEIEPSYPVKFHMGERKLSIPYHYETGRQTPERINCAPVRDSFEFAFWMPDLRAPVDDSYGIPGWRPQERGRSKPGVNEFLVKVSVAENTTDATVTPSIMFKNLVELADGRYTLKIVQDGLIQLDLTDHDDDSHPTFVSLDDGRDELMITCFPPMFNEPACKFELAFRDLSLTIKGTMPENGLPRWRAVKAGMRTLLEHWIVK